MDLKLLVRCERTLLLYAEAYYNRGIVHLNLGNEQAAIEDYTQAIRLDPNHADAYNSRANIYRQLGNKEEAIADFHQAADLYLGKGDMENYYYALEQLQKLEKNQ